MPRPKGEKIVNYRCESSVLTFNVFCPFSLIKRSEVGHVDFLQGHLLRLGPEIMVRMFLVFQPSVANIVVIFVCEGQVFIRVIVVVCVNHSADVSSLVLGLLADSNASVGSKV